jgi:Beta-propeller repeat
LGGGGESGSDIGTGIAVDGGGSAYVMGQTGSPEFPITPGAAQTTHAGNWDAFVTELDASGSGLVFSTYLGGSEVEFGGDIALDGAGSVYVTGQTTSTDFPTTAGAAQTTHAQGFDAFVTKLDATGSGLVYSTYLGGIDTDRGLDIAVDAAGSAYVTGQTHSGDFPTTAGAAQTTLAGFSDAFVAKIEFAVPLPTSTDQCRNGGWKTFGVFKNQGDCVSFVASKGKNPPSGP